MEGLDFAEVKEKGFWYGYDHWDEEEWCIECPYDGDKERMEIWWASMRVGKEARRKLMKKVIVVEEKPVAVGERRRLLNRRQYKELLEKSKAGQ